MLFGLWNSWPWWWSDPDEESWGSSGSPMSSSCTEIHQNPSNKLFTWLFLSHKSKIVILIFDYYLCHLVACTAYFDFFSYNNLYYVIQFTVYVSWLWLIIHWIKFIFNQQKTTLIHVQRPTFLNSTIWDSRCTAVKVAL